MITQEQNLIAKEQAAEFIQQCADYKALLESMGLPYSVDIEAHKRIIRLRIADELLKADAGLKMRWDILRTEAGRQKLRQETAATVDLAGYEDVEQLQQRLQELRFAYNSVDMLPDQYRVSFDLLAGHYHLDLATVIDSRTMTWDGGKEKVLAYFEELAQHLHQAQKVMQSLGRNVYPIDSMFSALTSYYKYSTGKGPMKPDEEKIYAYVLPELQERGLLTDFPESIQ